VLTDPAEFDALVTAIRSGDEALDRGLRGPATELALLRDAGLLAAPLQTDLGGKGWGTTPTGALPMLDILSALGSASLPVARIYEGHVNALKLVTAFATMSQKDKVAAAVHRGTVLGVWGADSPAPVSITVSSQVPRLIGRKSFASGLGDVGLAIITAKSSDGLQMVMADVRDPERATQEDWDVAAMVGSRSGSFNCENLAAGRDELLGSPGALFAEPDFHGGLWRLTACYAGALGRIATLTADAIEKSDAVKSQSMEHRVGQLAMEATSASLWARHACLAVEHGLVTAEAAVSIALFAREAVELAALRALSISERIIGTAVHRRGSEIGRRSRDLRFYLRQADLDGKLSLATQYWLNNRQNGSYL